MMTMSGFLRGMAIGVVAGVAVDMVANSKAMRKTGLGKTMQSVGCAMDDMICDVKHAIH